MSVEEPKFKRVAAEGDFEIRDYPGLVVAEAVVDGERQSALNAGFRLLAGYIFGANAGSGRIAMTAPVSQAPAPGSTIAMTAPVTVSGQSSGWTVRFTMPSQYVLEELPAPNDSRVQLKSIPPARMAVVRFSGLTGDRRVAQQAERLVEWLRRRNLTAAGTPSLARYDPPWTPWFMRRNEVMVAIDAEPPPR